MSPPRRKAGAAKSKTGRKPARGSARSKAAKRRAAKRGGHRKATPASKRGASAGRKKADASKLAKRKKATAPKKAAARKKAAAPKKAAGPEVAPTPEPALRKPARTPRRGRPRKRPPDEFTGIPLRSGPGPVSKLGTKYKCFSCQAKFYDLNRPEPICPKCGADQRDRPKEDGRPGVLPVARRSSVRPMAPLLDDDEGAVRDEEVDLGLESAEVLGADFLDNAVAGDEPEDDSEDR